jgi:hypothetical protein
MLFVRPCLVAGSCGQRSTEGRPRSGTRAEQVILKNLCCLSGPATWQEAAARGALEASQGQGPEQVILKNICCLSGPATWQEAAARGALEAGQGQGPEQVPAQARHVPQAGPAHLLGGADD